MLLPDTNRRASRVVLARSGPVIGLVGDLIADAGLV
jgi:hypothetical protein